MLVNPKEDDFLGYINSPTIKTEQDQVSYSCVCLLLDTIYECPILHITIYCVHVCQSVSVNKYNSCDIVNGNTSTKI